MKCLGIWFVMLVFSILVGWLFDWLMQKSGIGVIAGTAATLLSLVGGLHLSERFVRYYWHRDPVSADLPVLIAIAATTVIATILTLAYMKRKFFDN